MSEDICQPNTRYYTHPDELDFKPLTVEEETELVVRAKDGDAEAKAKLFQCFLRFAEGISKRAACRRIPENDAISAGNEGLVQAFERFDPTRGYRFSSYAMHFIRGKVLAAVRDAMRNNGREPRSSGVGQVGLVENIPLSRDYCRTLEEFDHTARKHPYDQHQTVQYKSTLGAEPQNTDAESSGLPELNDTKSFNLKLLEKFFPQLSLKEREVVRMKFYENQTFEEIGNRLPKRVTRQRAEQIFAGAIVKLRDLFNGVSR